MKGEIKILLREGLVKVFENQLSPTDKQVVDYILGGELNEADGGQMYNKFIKLLKSGKRKLITAAVMTTLLSNTAFSAELSKAPDDVKAAIEQISQQSIDNTASISDDNQTNIKDNDSGDFTINFSEVFKSGSYNLHPEAVKHKLSELKSYLLKNKGTSFDIVITASESQVPNQSGFSVGELAKKRASVMEKVINNYLSSNGLENTEVKIKTKVGDVKWDGKNAHDSKYTKDQYVKLDLFITTGVSPCELDFTESGEVASAKDNYISHEQELDEGGTLTINPGSIPDRMVVTTSDGKILSDTGYFADAHHQYKEFKYVPLYVAKLSTLLNTNPSSPAIKGLESTTKSFNEFGQLIKFMLKDKGHKVGKDTRTEVLNGINGLRDLWKSGQREFVFYTTKKGNVEFNIGDNDKASMVVYSPIGKTGYSVKGTCK